MRRWHAERDLMLRRWRQEIASHENYAGGPLYPPEALAPVPPTDGACHAGGPCHCYRGMGFMRKRTAFGCPHPRCAICHWGKWDKRGRAGARRTAIEHELAACGHDARV